MEIPYTSLTKHTASEHEKKIVCILEIPIAHFSVPVYFYHWHQVMLKVTAELIFTKHFSFSPL